MFKPLQKAVRPLLSPLFNKEPGAKLIRETALQQWRVVLINILSSITDSLTEGATLALVFLAVEVMSTQSSTVSGWSKVPLVGSLPGLDVWLASVPSKTLFLILLVLALLVQFLQGFSRL
jgi:ATP-binding cassette, subfamily B, bacterial MsbA